MAHLNSPINRFTFILMSVLFLSNSNGAQIYKWTDQDGNVHFGDSPPEDADAQSLNLPEGPDEQQIEEAEQQFQAEIDRRRQLEATREAQKKEIQKEDPNWKFDPVWPPSCKSNLAFQRFPEFNGARAKMTLRGTDGEWKGKVRRLQCKRTSNLPDECKKTASSITLGKQAQALQSRCRRIAMETRKVEEVSSLLGEGRVHAQWNERKGQLLLQSTLIDKKTGKQETIHHYLGISDSLYYQQKERPPLSSDWENLIKPVNQVGVRYQGKETLAFEKNRQGGYVQRNFYHEFFLPSYQSYFQLRLSEQNLILIQAGSPLSPSEIIVWDLHR